jgi:precorrin-6y C5,15-methyltransferase (decarboxylating), CbiE subunit/precorrin-6Y C5,15-methyltransferase (decarboxylating), CbiT subunit
MNRLLYVIGIGYRPLDKEAGEIISSCDVVIASKRHMDRVKSEELRVKSFVSISPLEEALGFIRENLKRKKIAVLASGDPLFFGIGRRLLEELGRERVEFIPAVSSMQLAFAKIKEPWDDAFLMSLHGVADPEKRRRPYDITDIPFLLQRHNKIAILTDKENNPATIAKEILKSSAFSLQPSTSKMFVCERLGYHDEKITEGSPEVIVAMSFPEPNVVIIQQESEVTSHKSEVRFGLTEGEISHAKGLITKDEVRAVTIHKLRLPQRGVFWDIGAGSGSVSIEVARLFPELKVFAIERDGEQIRYLKENKIKFGAANIEIVKGEAPEFLKNIPLPDRVFIGGSGGRLEELLRFIDKLPTRIVVINAATIETFNKAMEKLNELNFTADAIQLSVSRLKLIGDGNYFSAFNPVFVIKGERLTGREEGN